VIANQELAFQNQEKENRAAELLIANQELAFQNEEKEKRAAELLIANQELAFQSEEKEKRAAELLIANQELAFQSEEKEKRAAELVIANQELAFQNEEKEKRAAELIGINKELQVFAYISSHDLQEPLRKIQVFADQLLINESDQLTAAGKHQLLRMQVSAKQMRTLIVALQVYSHINLQQQTFAVTGINPIAAEMLDELSEKIAEKAAVIHTGDLGEARINEYQFKQVLWHLIDNALKFSRVDTPPEIHIRSRIATGSYCKKRTAYWKREIISYRYLLPSQFCG
jgi:signal transduction histidine kinase